MKILPLLFAVYAVLFSAVIAWKLPVLMGPDESNHIRRANMISRGSLIGKRFQAGGVAASGGSEEVHLLELDQIMEPMKFHPEVKMGQLDVARFRSMTWGDQMSDQSFENTVVYPPLFYVPSAIGLAIGKGMGLSIFSSVLVARVIGAILCILVGVVALVLAGRARFYLFTVLLLPMSAALFASVTQDGLLLVTAALGCSFLVRGLSEGRPMTKSEVWGAAACLALVGTAKPPYILLSYLLLLIQTERPVWGRVGAGLAAAVGVGWQVLMGIWVQTPLVRAGFKLDPGAQMVYLLHHPAAPVTIAYATIRHSAGEYVSQFIGVLGWLDTVLPKLYYGVALLALLGVGVGIWSVDPKSGRRSSLGTLVLLGLTAVGVFAALYVAYTPVGNPVVDGVQGRYFLPLALFLPVGLMGPREGEKRVWTQWLTVGVLLFPLVSILVVERALAVRYY